MIRYKSRSVLYKLSAFAFKQDNCTKKLNTKLMFQNTLALLFNIKIFHKIEKQIKMKLGERITNFNLTKYFSRKKKPIYMQLVPSNSKRIRSLCTVVHVCTSNKL